MPKSCRMAYDSTVVMYFVLASEDERFFGIPMPAPAVRVSFDPERFFVARERNGRAVERRLIGGEGLVVHECATDELIWPASLWRVVDLERPVRPMPGNRWVRCLAFTVVDQVPTWLVAGPHGDAVEWVINQARALTAEQVGRLASMPEESEEPLCKALWERWMRARRSGSPVGCGLTTLYKAVDEAARRVGPLLFGWSEEDGIEVLTDPAWRKAGRAAYAAALALGAPELVSSEQGSALALRWTSVLGAPVLPDRQGS